MPFIRKRKDEEEYSWDGGGGEESHSMWGEAVKKLLRKVGLC